MVKVVASNQIAALVNDSATVYTCGFGLAGFPEEVAIKLKESYLATGHPRNLHLYFAACIGNTKNRGIHHFAPEGMVKRMVGGHFGVCGPDISRLISDNKVEAYNFPQGVLAGMPRNIAARRPGLITKVGLGTFVDPRLQGGKITTQTTEDLVRLIELDGEEWLYYKAPKVDVALIRGTVADEHGNLTLDREGLILETISVAQAAKNCGGIVIAQVEQVTFSGPYAAAANKPVLYITERAVFQLTAQGLELIEIAPGIDLERDVLQHMEFTPIMNNVNTMDPAIFEETWGGLAAIL